MLPSFVPLAHFLFFLVQGYLYIPLGGNKEESGQIKHLYHIFSKQFWHGARLDFIIGDF
jgi:D-alanyl-lipoteichoic acid acyltransferase DltB (MBOAT superfamily)